MNSLEEKLRDIFKNWHQTGCPFSERYGKCINADCHNKKKPLVEQIIQAFKDDGWQRIATPVLSTEDNQVHYYFDRADKVWKKAPAKFMTGQEWYDRFADRIYDIPETKFDDKTPGSEEEWGKNHADLWIPQREAVKAAKRASSIEDAK
jgi:hypothetical protein